MIEKPLMIEIGSGDVTKCKSLILKEILQMDNVAIMRQILKKRRFFKNFNRAFFVIKAFAFTMSSVSDH
jgi:hypothetical protein